MQGRIRAPLDIEHGRENPHIPLATSIMDELDNELDKVPTLSSNCCIYKVPEKLRSVNSKAYTPQVISIGPLHHEIKKLKPMEQHKMRYLNDFLGHTKLSLVEYIEKIKGQEAKLLNCYAEPIGSNSDQFVKIILVDAAFIVELLLKNHVPELQDENDPIFKNPQMISHILPDMLLLENQLPFFILEDLFYTVKRDCNSAAIANVSSIFDLSYKLFESILDIKWTEDNLKEISSSSFKHFVDLIRTLHLPLGESKITGRLTTLTTPSITELHQAGIKFENFEKFEKKKSVESKKFENFKKFMEFVKFKMFKKFENCGEGSSNLLALQFIDDVLIFPKIRIQDDTELKLRNIIAFEQGRNIIAFEQCHVKYYSFYVTDFVTILDNIVNTTKDVDLLAADGVLENLLGDSSKVSTMINNLCNGVVWDPKRFYFATVSKDLNKHCKKRRHKWKADLRQKYFNTPWTTISIFAAFVLLVLTVIQTVCSIISVS